ncbi:MAG: outer membrane beta-barrel protein [Luteitalea sp.]|nr:outer membrane beta-barrel protein [Luteitalea sp.]
MTCGRISASPKSRTLRRRICCSSVRRKSMDSVRGSDEPPVSRSHSASSAGPQSCMPRLGHRQPVSRILIVMRDNTIMKRRHLIALVPLIMLAWVAEARADATLFLGTNTTPNARTNWGAAIGGGFVIVGWEIEYSRTSEDVEDEAPSLTTTTGNVYLQTPVPVGGMQFYGALGWGFYRERLNDAEGNERHQETSVTSNIGGGVKVGLAGPLRLRVDYRYFTLHGDPLYDHAHRLYAGLNLGF